MGDKGVFFMHRIRHYKKSTGEWVWDKGIEVKDAADTDNFGAAKQSFHAYLAAYAYEHDKDKQTGKVLTDYVACFITDISGSRLMFEVWQKEGETNAVA